MKRNFFKVVISLLIILLFSIFIRKQFISLHKDIKKISSHLDQAFQNQASQNIILQSKDKALHELLSKDKALHELLYWTSDHTTKQMGIPINNFVNLFKKYDVYNSNESIKLIRLGKDNDGGYIVPEIALKKAEALIGYGISTDISFEEQFSEIYHKPSYGFDCTITNITIQNKLTTFIPQCIKNSKNHSLPEQWVSFDKQLNYLNLENKKIFIKIDIEGNEYDIIDDVLENAKNITGIAMEVHFFTKLEDFKKANDLITKLTKDFLLVHYHGNAYATKVFRASNLLGVMTRAMELTFINKNLVDRYEISLKQKSPLEIDMPTCPGCKDEEFEILE